MTKIIPAGILFIALLIAANSGTAAETEVSLGVKVWANKWKEEVKPDSAHNFVNGRELMVGPSLSVRYSKNWFADLSYLTTLNDYESEDWLQSGDKITFERADMDILAGALLQDPYNPLKVGFFLAYKTIDAPAAYTNQAAGLDHVNAGTWKLKGPGLGTLVEWTLDESTALSGSVAYMFLEQEFAYSSGPASRCDTDGWEAEIAVKRVFINSVSASAGVKFQRFKGKRDGLEITDSFSGLSGRIVYTF